MSIELRQLKCFVSAATHLSFTKAAKECFVVQSSMTEQIVNLENELGVKLFDRQRKGLLLTEAGEFFLPKAKALLLEAQQAQEEMKSFQEGYRGLLRIGYRGELFKEDLIQNLKAYHEKLPRVRVTLRQLQEKELLEGLRDGQFDLILTSYRKTLEEDDHLEFKIVEETGAVLVVAKNHPLSGRESVSYNELKDMPVLRMKDQRLEREMGKKASERPELQNMKSVMDHTSSEILIASGYAVGLWAERLSKHVHNPELAFVKVTGEYEIKKYVLAWKRGKLSPEGMAFCRCFR